jgi:membrane protein implicated in regulation of membrane protease activity
MWIAINVLLAVVVLAFVLWWFVGRARHPQSGGQSREDLRQKGAALREQRGAMVEDSAADPDLAAGVVAEREAGLAEHRRVTRG